jgi:hypothetical protein
MTLPFTTKQESNAGITRRAAPLILHDIIRVRGRVHATVRPPTSGDTKHPRYRVAAFRRSNARHHPPAHKIEEI